MPSSEPMHTAEVAFWNEALRALPDATFVFLPPPRPTPVAGRIATIEQAREIREAAVAALASAWSVLTDGLPAPAHARSTWWTQWQGTDVQIQATSRHAGLGPGLVRQRLSRVQAALAALGERADGLGATAAGPARLRATWRSYRVEVNAIRQPVAVDVTLTGLPWAADDELVTDLIGRPPDTMTLDPRPLGR